MISPTFKTDIDLWSNVNTFIYLSQKAESSESIFPTADLIVCFQERKSAKYGRNVSSRVHEGFMKAKICC